MIMQTSMLPRGPVKRITRAKSTPTPTLDQVKEDRAKQAAKAKARQAKPTPRKAKRRLSEFARSYHSRARVRFVRSLPCPVCIALLGHRLGESDNAHIVGGGAGRKAEYTAIVPLCRLHHRALHSAGSLGAFYVMFGCRVDLAAEAAQTESLWARGTEG